MLPGFDGRLVAEQFLERYVVSAVADGTADGFTRGLRRWRERVRSLGPASSERAIVEQALVPLTKLLGYSNTTATASIGGGRQTLTIVTGAATVSVFVARYGEPLDPLTRKALSAAAQNGATWSLLFNGTHVRLLHVARAGSRRFVEIDLDAAADEPRTAAALWMLASASALDSESGRSSTARLVERSDQHGAQVCRWLRDGVVDATATILDAFVAGRRRVGSADAFAQSLTLVYRILFLFFAEARGLLPTWHPIYRDSYSLRELCEGIDARRTGVWDTLQAIGRMAHSGCRAGDLRVTPYNGRLFAPARAPLIERPNLPEAAARRALISLSTHPAADGEGRERIAYRDLGVEQLGAVYETLLEYEPANDAASASGASRSLSLRRGGRERKRTGSFYTPEPLARYLIRRTLGPLVHDAAPERILALRVLDPAMGSGAFLVNACRYLADAYAESLVASGGCHPTDLGPTERARIRRTVAERCLYGVDLNPMAVQLAQLSLWLATLAADRPLGFLDHHLVAGNSLLGAWLSALRHAPSRRRGRPAMPLFDDERLEPMLRTALPLRFSIVEGPTETVGQIRDKEKALQALTRRDTALSRWKRLADLWTSVWLDPRQRAVPAVFPALSDTILTGTSALAARITSPHLDASAEAAAEHRPFHWELEFPEVFFTSGGERRADAGFDAIVGNPPWDMLRNDDRQGAAASRIVRFARDSGAYDVRSEGQVNSYQLFVERSIALTAAGGRIGLVLPGGLAVDHGSGSLRRWLFSSCAVESLVGFENRRAIFDIHRGVRFVLLSAVAGASTDRFHCRLGETDPDRLEQACDDRGVLAPAWWPLRLSPSSLEQWSGPGLAVPDVRSALDVAIVDRLSNRFLRLGDAAGWGATFGRELNATEDRDAFAGAGEQPIAIVEGKHIEPFAVNRRAARVSMSAADARARLGTRHLRRRLAYRDVSSPTNRQTLIAGILPAGTASTHTVMCLRSPLSATAQWYLCGLFNSFVVNYLVRLRVTTHVTTSTVEQLPMPTESDAGAAFTAIAGLARLYARTHDAGTLAALQGRVARLYELTFEEFAHVLGTFPLAETSERERAMTAFTAWQSVWG